MNPDPYEIAWRISENEYFVSAPYTDKFIHGFASISSSSFFDSVLKEWRIPKSGIDSKGFEKLLNSISKSDPASIDQKSNHDRNGLEFGYASVETNEGAEKQIDALRKIGIPDERLYLERTKTKNSPRPEFDFCLKKISAGDTIVVTSLDKFGRSLRQLNEATNSIKARGGHFYSINEGIDTRELKFRFFVENINYAADFEAQQISIRTKAGIIAAKEKGNRGGRPRKMTRDKARQAVDLVLDGRTSTEIARALAFGSESTYYRNVPYGMAEIRAIYKDEGQGGIDRLIEEIATSLQSKSAQKIRDSITTLHKEGATDQMIADKFHYRLETIQKIISKELK